MDVGVGLEDGAQQPEEEEEEEKEGGREEIDPEVKEPFARGLVLEIPRCKPFGRSFEFEYSSRSNKMVPMVVLRPKSPQNEVETGVLFCEFCQTPQKVRKHKVV